jgi:hypothetical protein
MNFICAAEDMDKVDWDRLAITVKTHEASLEFYTGLRQDREARITMCLALESALRLTKTAE